METKIPSRSVILAFILVVIFAGNNAIAVRYSNVELPPFFGAAIRLALAAAILFLIVLVFRLPLPHGRGFLGAALFGFIGSGLNFAFLYWALETLHPGLSMVILALVPLMTFLLACIQRQEVFRWKALFGSLIALGGIGVIVWNQLGARVPLLPILAVVAAAVCFAEANVLIKVYPQSHPITTNAIGLTTGAITLFILSAIFREAPRLPSLTATWVALAFLVLCGSVAVFSLSVYVIKHWTASASSYQFVLFPIVTIAVSAWLTKEPITLPLIVGAALVLLGVYIGGIANLSQLERLISALRPRGEVPCPDC